YGPHDGLRRPIRARATLVELWRPLRRKVAVQIEPLQRRRNLDRHPAVVLDPSLGDESVERPAVRTVHRLAPYQQLRLRGVPPPRPIRILDAHVEHAAVAVQILDPQSVVLLLTWIRAHARADEPALFEPVLSAVGIQPRDHVEDACIQSPSDDLVLSVADQQLVNQ